MNYPERITINVTEQDIIRGVPDDVCKCPIARALKRKLHIKHDTPETVMAGVRARIDALTVHDNIYGPWDTFYITTDESIRFMENFDHGKSVKPQKFTFERGTV